MSDSHQEHAGNGVERTKVELTDTVTLTYNRVTDHLEVGGKCNSLDLILDMLNRATRIIEHKWRLERLAEVQKQAADAARTAAILESVRNKR